MNEAERINPGYRGDKGKLVCVLMVAKVAAGAGELADDSGKCVAGIGAAKQDIAVIGARRIVHPADADVHAKNVAAGRELQIRQHFIGEIIGARIHAGNSSTEDRKSTRLNSSHVKISYAVFCLKKKKKKKENKTDT